MKSSIDFDYDTIIAEEQSWFTEIAVKLGKPGRPDLGYKALKAVLHSIRDILLLEEVFYLSARLPLFTRGIYFEGYDPETTPNMLFNRELLKNLHKRMGPRNGAYIESYLYQNTPEKITGEEFLQRISDKMESGSNPKPEDAFQAVVDVLHSRGSALEMDEIKNLMHREVSHFLA
jgi:uncharacterized protein (DUF2267 family)